MAVKKTIAVDIDDVIADTTNSHRQKVNQLTGLNLTAEHYRVPGAYWGYYERVWRSHGSQISLVEVESEMAVDQSYIPLLPGAQFALGELTKKFRVVLVTSRETAFETATRAWLTNHFGEQSPEVYFAKGHPESTGKTKGELCNELGAAYLVDDCLDHCLSAQACNVQAVLFGDYGWQKPLPENDFVHCSDWQAVLEYFNGQ